MSTQKDPSLYYNTAKSSFELYRNDRMLSEVTDSERDHVIELGASVMMTRDYEKGIPGLLLGGSFVRAIVRNDLDKAVNLADSTSIKILRFLVYLRNYVHP